MASTSLTPEDGAPGAGPDWADDAATKQDARPPPRKRRRIVISCTECHRRKQRVSLTRPPVRPSPSKVAYLSPPPVRPQVPLHQLRLPQQAECMQLRNRRAHSQKAQQPTTHHLNHHRLPYPEAPPPASSHPHPQPNRLPPLHPRRLRRLLPRLRHPKQHPLLSQPPHLPRNNHPTGSRPRCRRRQRRR